LKASQQWFFPNKWEICRKAPTVRIIHGTSMSLAEGAVATIGKFEGLHRGHQALIGEAQARALELGLPSMIITFDPHPAEALKGAPYKALFSKAEREALFGQTGIDILASIPFSREFASLPPEAFEKLLFVDLNCRALVVGRNFSYGKGRSGTAETLLEAGKAFDATVSIFGSVFEGEKRISSSLIREAIAANDFKIAEKLMGRPYFISGTIAHGKELGRTIGFPTMNILPAPDKLLPENGVYATKTLYQGEVYCSMTNVGRNPTVGGSGTTVETYLLGFDKCVYGENAQVSFVERLRDETKFQSVDSLRLQLEKDSLAMRRIFGLENE
jgi:riboflavin kinase/FMN adenylyltransferase